MTRNSGARQLFSLFQRGVASVGIAFLILFLIAAALATTFSVTGSVVQDASASDQRLQALHLAESGLEWAAGLYMNSPLNSNCTGTSTTSGTFKGLTLPYTSPYTSQPVNGSSISGSFTILSAKYNSADGSCLVRVSGTPTNSKVVRTIESSIFPAVSSTTASTGSTTFTDNVPAGTNLLVVLVAWNTQSSSSDVTVKYQSQTLTKACGPPLPATACPAVSPKYSGGGGQYYGFSEIFYLLNPPVGPGSGSVALNGGGSANFSVGVLNFSGVDTSAPFSYYWGSPGAPSATYTANSFGQSVAISTGSAAVDVVARDNGGSLSTTGCARSPIWNTGSNTNPSAGSFCTPDAGATSATMTWDLNGNQQKAYAMSIAVVKASTSGGTGGRVRQSGSVGGLQNWREVFVPPN